MAQSPEKNDRLDFNPEALDPYLEAQKAEEILGRTTEFADAKEGLAKNTFEATHNVGPDRREAAQEDITSVERGKKFEENKYVDQFKLDTADSVNVYEAVLEEPVDTEYFHQADSHMADAGEYVIEGAQGAAGAYRSATSDNNGVSAIA